MHKQFICLNGEMIPSGAPSLMHTNRAFCYGDALFETIHANGTRLQFFDDHYNRLVRGMGVTGMEITPEMDREQLKASLIRLLNKNHLYNGVRVRLSIFRNTGGYYTPDVNTCSFLAETIPLEHDKYLLNEKGLKIDLFDGIRKQPDILANLKTANSLLYIIAAQYRKRSGLDDCILLNTCNRIIESVSSNIFLLKNGTLLTPSLDEGCVEGIMRRQIIRIAQSNGIECLECGIGEHDLLEAEECFLTNAISGIRWVVAFRHRRFYNKTARMLTLAVNEEQFGK